MISNDTKKNAASLLRNGSRDTSELAFESIENAKHNIKIRNNDQPESRRVNHRQSLRIHSQRYSGLQDNDDDQIRQIPRQME